MVAAVLGVAIAPAAMAAPSDDSEARSQLVNVDGLGLDLLEALGQESAFPSDPGADFGEIEAELLETLGLSVGLGDGLQVPLIGDGTNGGLLDLGPLAGVGALGSYAHAEDATTATAATGVVNNQGTIDLDPIDDPAAIDNARLDLTALLDQLQVAGLTDQLVNEVSVGLGAFAARAEATGVDTYTSDYVLADAQLQVVSPAVGGIADTLATTYGTTTTTVEGAVNGLVAPGGLVDNALGTLALPPVTIPLLANVTINRPTATVAVDLPALDEALLEEAVSDTGLVTIDLTNGTIAVDLAQLVDGPTATDLNGLDPNTEVLTDETIEAITAGIAEALGNVVDSINEEVVDALEATRLTVNVGATVTLLSGLASAPLNFTVSGTLADFAGTSGTAPVVSTVSDIVLLGITIPAGSLVNLVVTPTVGLITGVLGPVVNGVLTTQSTVVETALVGVVDAVLEPLEPVLDGVLSQIVSLTINEQPTEAPINGEGDLGPDSFTVRALGIDLLPGLLGIGVDLASASVRANDLPAALTASPDPVQQGGTVTATATNFAPETPITITYVDSGGETVETEELVTNGSGDVTDSVVLPDDVALGTLTVTADDGTDELTDSVQVVEAVDEPTLTASPDPVQQGGTLTATGLGFAPSTPVDLIYVDADGETVETDEVTSDGAGGFSDAITVPEDAPLGDLTVTADDGADELSQTVQVVPAAVEPSVTASPDPVQQGGTVSADGVGFAPNSTVTVTYTDADGVEIDSNEAPTDGAGGFSDSATVPEDAPLGDLTVTADDGTDTDSDTVEVIAAAVVPSVTASPDPVQQGGTVTADGVGFAPNSTVTVTYTDADGVEIDSSTAPTDGAGGFSDSITVPTDTPLGELTVTADDGTDSDSDTVQVIAAADEPSVTASPDPVQQGGDLEVVGVGFTPSTPVTIVYTDADGNEVETTETTTDGAGGFTDTITVPEGTPLGDLTIEADDGTSTVTETVEVVEAADEPSVTASPDPVQIGGTVEVVGVGFAPNSSVTVTYLDSDGGTVVERVVDTDGAGGFVDDQVIPAGTPLGTLTVSADDGDDTASDTVQVIAAAAEPSVTATPDPVQQGGDLEVVGVGFEPNTPVTIVYTDADGNEVEATETTTDGAGGFTDTITVPEGTPLGDLTIEADDGTSTVTETVEVVAAADEPSVTASPDPVQIGGTVDVVGVGFAPNSSVTVTYVDADGVTIVTQDATTDGAGGFTDDLVVPDDTPLGELTVSASDGDVTAGDTVQVIAAADEPSVTASPDPVQQGGDLEVVGVGFEPNTPVTVVYTDADGNEVATSETTTDGAGGFTDTITVPEDTPLGDLTIEADDGTSTVTETVEVVEAADEPSVTASPDPVAIGSPVTVTGVGFAPDSSVTITLTDADGDVVATRVVPTDGAGGFSQSITVPEGTALGDLTVDAEDAEGGTATDVVEVVAGPAEPTVEASPDPVEIGEDLTVVGEGFPPDTEVTVTYTDSEGNVVGENVVTTDEDGGFTDTFTVPEGTSVGTLEVEATGGGETATDTTTVLEPGVEYEPEIEVTPGTVPPGQPVTTECVGFPPNTDVTITYTDSTGRVVATREVTTDAEGGCTDTVTLPEDTAPGPLTVSATGGGFTAEETILVVDPDAITIDIAEPTLYRGDVQTGTGSGYAPGAVVQGFMNSTPQLDLGTQVADENGDVTFTWTIPQNAAIDTHTFSLTADGYPDQSVDFQVLATPGPGLPGTGADVAMAGFAASGMFLVGLLLMAATRVAARRRNGVL